MPRYIEGQKVRIIRNLQVNEEMDVTEYMLEYAGMQTIINCVMRRSGRYFVDGNDYYWREELLVPNGPEFLL